MIYLGTLGRMVGLKCPASQQVAVDERITFEPTLGGRKVGQIAPGNPKRVWQNQLSDASTPAQVGAVMAFINGEWGNGPFIYVSADAPGVNLLTPAAASCDPAEVTFGKELVTSTPPAQLPDGSWAGRSIVKSSGQIILGTTTPVLPGVPVTVSAYVLGAGGAVRLQWHDANDVAMAVGTSTVLSTDGQMVRSWLTETPPVGAVGVRIGVNPETTQFARPAITWTDQLFDWGNGQGCAKAVVHGASSGLVLASSDPRGGRYSNLGFTVTEVG